MNTLLKILAAPWRATSQAAQGFLSLTLAARIAWAVALLQVFVVLMALRVSGLRELRQLVFQQQNGDAQAFQLNV